MLQTMQKSRDFLEADHRASGRAGSGHTVVCPHCQRFALEDCIWWCAACAAITLGEPEQSLGHTAKVFRAHAPPQGLFEGLAVKIGDMGTFEHNSHITGLRKHRAPSITSSSLPSWRPNPSDTMGDLQKVVARKPADHDPVWSSTVSPHQKCFDHRRRIRLPSTWLYSDVPLELGFRDGSVSGTWLPKFSAWPTHKINGSMGRWSKGRHARTQVPRQQKSVSTCRKRAKRPTRPDVRR